MSLAARFPTEVWVQAQLYFSSPSCGSSSDVGSVTGGVGGVTMETNEVAAACRESSADVCGATPFPSNSGAAGLEDAACDQ